MAYLYGLFYENESGENICFYIGKGTGNRLYQHFCRSNLKRSRNPHKVNKIRKLRRENEELLSKKLAENLTDKQAYNLEDRLLKKDDVFEAVTNISRSANGNEKIELPYECLEKLGEVSDSSLAEEYEVCKNTIRDRRMEKEIEACYNLGGGHNRVELSRECVNQLGQKSDYKLAEEYGVSHTTIRNKRQERGIEAHGYGKKIELSDKCIKQLGKKSDRKLAEEYGVSCETIRNRRQERDIEAHGHGKRMKLPQKCINQLGQKSDRQLAREYEVSKAVIGNRRREKGIEAYNSN